MPEPQAPSASIWKSLGPGFLFAGAAIGVSHLVQSTRAGASFGLGLLAFLALANLVKYPAFSFGPRFAAATGKSLLEGYRSQGRWALWLYFALTVGTMFTVQGAVTMVTAGLFKATCGFGDVGVITLSVALTAFCGALVLVGSYRWLDRVTKFAVGLLTLSTVVATVLALGKIPWSTVQWWPAELDLKTWVFIAAYVGWMPSAIDISVWHSLWALARGRDTGRLARWKVAKVDFNIGYFATAGLGLSFMLLGCAVFYGSGVPIENSAVGLAHQVIELYTGMLGEWSRYLIGASAFSVMFSTTLTVVDGFARALSTLWDRMQGPELPEVEAARPLPSRRPVFWVAYLLVAVGALTLIGGFASRLKGLVDLATTISFVTAPMLAALNHRAMMSASVPLAERPGHRMRAFSLVCIVVMAGMAAGYLWIRFIA